MLTAGREGGKARGREAAALARHSAAGHGTPGAADRGPRPVVPPRVDREPLPGRRRRRFPWDSEPETSYPREAPVRPVRLMVSLLFTTLVLAPAAARADEGGGWHWVNVPYIWGTGMDGTVGIGPARAEVDQSFSDVVSHLDLGAMMRLEGQGARWGISFDVAYVNLSETTKPGDAEVTSEQINAELDATYRVNDHFQALVGGRFWKLNNDVDFANPVLNDVDAERDWLDPVVGFIAKAPMGDHWEFRFRGDVGGFGAGSDLSWQAELAFGWKVNEKFTLVLGYRVLEVDYDSGSGAREFVYDVSQQGPGIGFAIRLR